VNLSVRCPRVRQRRHPELTPFGSTACKAMWACRRLPRAVRPLQGDLTLSPSSSRARGTACFHRCGADGRDGSPMTRSRSRSRCPMSMRDDYCVRRRPAPDGAHRDRRRRGAAQLLDLRARPAGRLRVAVKARSTAGPSRPSPRSGCSRATAIDVMTPTGRFRARSTRPMPSTTARSRRAAASHR
jgi:hypothetical protein